MKDCEKLKQNLMLSECKRSDLAHMYNTLKDDHIILQRQYFKLQNNFEDLLKHKMKDFIHTLYTENGKDVV